MRRRRSQPAPPSQRTRRAERATERAGIEEKLKLLQAQSLSLMRQLKLVSAHEETQKRRAKGAEVRFEARLRMRAE